MNKKQKTVLGIFPVIMAIIALLAGPGVNLALADHDGGRGNGRGNEASQFGQQTAQFNQDKHGDDNDDENEKEGDGDNHIVVPPAASSTDPNATTTDIVSTSTAIGRDDNGNDKNNGENGVRAALQVQIRNLEALVQKLIARLLLIEGRLGIVDVSAPVISSTSATNITTSTAGITWTTNELATSKVYFSTSTPVNLATAANVLGASFVTSHAVGLSGLNAGTTYFYVVESKDAANNTATSTENSFATLP